jgi:hypothetical protein
MLLYTCSKAAINTIDDESVEGRSGNDSHFLIDIMLPVWEQELSLLVDSSPILPYAES